MILRMFVAKILTVLNTKSKVGYVYHGHDQCNEG